MTRSNKKVWSILHYLLNDPRNNEGEEEHSDGIIPCSISPSYTPATPVCIGVDTAGSIGAGRCHGTSYINTPHCRVIVNILVDIRRMGFVVKFYCICNITGTLFTSTYITFVVSPCEPD